MNKVTVLLVLFILFLISCSEDKESYYSDYNNMKMSESYKKGWIPGFIPESATNIYEKHNLDNNNVWIKLKCNQLDLANVANSLSLAHMDEPKVKELKQYFNLDDSTSFYFLSDEEVIGVEYNTDQLFYYRDP